MKKIVPYFLFLLCITAAAISVYLPNEIAYKGDNGILGKIRTQTDAFYSGGYRYSMTSGEKLYILAKSLDNRSFIQSDYAAYVKNEAAGRNSNSTYTYIMNIHGSAANEIGRESVMEVLNAQILELCDKGVFTPMELSERDYDIDLYNAVDILDPQKNISVWQIIYNKPVQKLKRKNTLIEAYMDAQTGKLYCFSYRASGTPDFYDEDGMIAGWCEYMEIESFEPYDNTNPLAELTPHFKKYTAGGPEGGRTLVTVGYYEGINEVFLKIE